MSNQIITNCLEHIEKEFLKLTEALTKNATIAAFDEFNVLTNTELVKLKYYVVLFNDKDETDSNNAYEFFVKHVQFKQQIERKRTELLTQYFEVKKLLQ